MDNKDEKTFKDLFSDSTPESGKTIKTFSDILNNSNIDEANNRIEKRNETNSNITFDSLFDQISNEEENKESISSSVDLEETSIEVNQPINFNSIFETKEENSNNEEVTISSEPIEEQKILSSPHEIVKENNLNDQLINDNPFFCIENTNIEETPTDENTDLSSQDETKEIVENANPFFTPETSQEDNLNKEIQENESKITNTLVEHEEINFEISPFMNIKEPSTENQKNIQIKEEIVDSNPFFETNTQNNVQNNTNFKELEKKEDLLPKSTSPFFEEEKESEVNPLFQNQLSLIENNSPSNTKANIDIANTKHYNVKVVKKKEPLIKFIIGVLSYALFIWLLLIGITLLVYVLDIKIRAAKGDYSSPKFNAYVVLTGSMLPEIQVYDVVVTKKVEASTLKEGDVITFASADSRFLGTIITHRIIKKNPPSGKEGYTFQTQGDNNNVADSALVPANNIYGKVILKIPKLGYLQEFLASDGGWIIVILIPCLTVISYDTVKLIKGLKNKKYKNIKVQK